MAAGSKDDAVRPQVLVLWSPQLEGHFEWDANTNADAEEKVWAFRRSLGYVAK